MWAQWGWACGPRIGARESSVFCAWLAWSRFWVVIPTWDRTLPTVIGCVDVAMRAFGGAPTYWLTNNERTVTTGHVAGIAIRNQELVAAARHYGIMIATCLPADPESKGRLGSDSPGGQGRPGAHRREPAGEYADFGALELACDEFTDVVNVHPHRATRRAPVEMLAEEQHRLHRVPEAPFTAAFGTTRKVSWSATSASAGCSIRCRTPWPTRSCGPGCMATSSSSSTSTRPDPPRWRAIGSPRPATHASTTPTTAAGGAGPPAQGDQPGRGRVLGHRNRCRVVAHRSRRSGNSACEGEDGRGGRARRPARARGHRLGAGTRGHHGPFRRR